MRHRPVHEDFLTTLWPREVLHLPRLFDQSTGIVVTGLFDSYRSGDLERAQLLFDCLAEARRHWPEEPQISSLDNGYAMAAAKMAESFVPNGDYSEAFDLVACGWKVLDALIARRERAGLSYYPCSEARSMLIKVLCDAKWRMPTDQFADQVLTQAEQAAAYIWCTENLDLALADGRIEEIRYRQRALGLLWTGLWVAVNCYRYLPELLPGVTRCFNTTHSHLGFLGNLDNQATVPPTHDCDASPFVWHYRLAILWLEAHRLATQGEILRIPELSGLIDACYASLSAAIQTHADSHENLGATAHLKQEREWIKRSLRSFSLHLN